MMHVGCFRAAVPSGASTGVHEAAEPRDGNKTTYVGKGVHVFLLCDSHTGSHIRL